MTVPRRKTAIIVAGMHRSGTSAITRVINLLGADLPRELMQPLPDNEAGFWEGSTVNAIHDRLLASAGSSWDDIREFPASWYVSDAATEYRKLILEYLERDLGASSVFVLKDPRICRILPLWKSILADFKADPIFVLPIRHPLDVAASLQVRNGFSPAKSQMLWLRHVLWAEVETRGYPRSIIGYDDLLRDWRGCVSKIARDTALSWPRSPQDAEAEITDFLSPQYRHHERSPGDLASDEGKIGWVAGAFSALTGHADLFPTMDVIQEQLRGADQAFGMLPVGDDVSQGN